MPELLKLTTQDFELSIWAKDITARAQTYEQTLRKRSRLAEDKPIKPPGLELRFSPALTLAKSTQALSPIAFHTLASPLFFENTQYQFEWLFFRPTSLAKLVHRSRAISDAFRFTPETPTPRGIIPARLSGTLNTGNDVGWLRLALEYEAAGQVFKQHFAFEILPTKMALHQDLPAMYEAIDRHYKLWRFSLVEKTEQEAGISKQSGHFPLMWLANFERLRQRFEQGLRLICAAPHSRLQPLVAQVKAEKLKGRLSPKLGERVKQDLAQGLHHKNYRVERKKLSVDTPENRFIKMAVSRSKKQLAQFEAKLRANNQAPEQQRLSDAFLDELHAWQQPLQKLLQSSFLTEVGDYAGLKRESLVLQQKTGYSSVYRIWQELKLYLDVFGSQASISMKSIAEIYEIWCFLSLKQLLEEELGFELDPNQPAAQLSQNDFFEYKLKDGFAGAFCFKRSDGTSARLAHEPKFTKKGQPIRSYLVSQEPDIVLEVTFPQAGQPSDQGQSFIWLFDAKYRIKTDKSRFDLADEFDIQFKDYAPDDAINQMHRYRDALIQLSQQTEGSRSSGAASKKLVEKSRPVLGAFALYPGFFDQTQETNPYAEVIDEIGIGAFALLPSPQEGSAFGHQWLLDFLKNQIGVPDKQDARKQPYSSAVRAEQLYIQEAARIPFGSMQQTLYPDLTLTAALGPQKGRDKGYLERFEQGQAHWYHIKQRAIVQLEARLQKELHLAKEVRYLALALPSKQHSSAKQIEQVWPVKGVALLPRYAITQEQAGKASTSYELYYLFELGRPLRLQTAISQVPLRNFQHAMKLTTLTLLEEVEQFRGIQTVYD